MITHAFVAALGLLLAPCAALSAEPHASMRALDVLQAQIATGHADPSAQAARLREIAVDFSAQPLSIWERPANARALAIFLFDGGDPSVGRHILSATALPETEARLVKAALTHAEGAQPAAREALAAIDPRLLPADLGGHVALAQAQYLATDNRPAALAKLDEVRLLSPGSLVEEAALRRSMFLLSEGGDATAFAEGVRRYRLRFASSAYAGNFERRVTDTLVARWPRASESERMSFAPAFESLTAVARGKAWLATARRALIEAMPAVAADAAARALREPTLVDDDRRGAERLLGVSRLFLGQAEEATRWLRARSGETPPADRNLMQAALLIADNIQAPMPPAARDTKGRDEANGVERTIIRGEALLGAVIP